MFRKARDFSKEIQMDSTVALQLLGKLRCNLVHHVHHKVSKERKGYNSLAEIGSAFLDSVFEAGAAEPPSNISRKTQTPRRP